MECISAYGMGSLHVLEGAMNAEINIKVLEQYMLPSRRRVFQGRPCVFQEDNVKPHTAVKTTSWLRSRRVRVLTWPACSPNLSPIEKVWRIIKWRIRQRRPQTLKLLETYIRQEWDQIPTPETHNLDAQTSSNYFEKKSRCSLNFFFLILAHVIWKSFSLNVITNKNASQHFWNSGCSCTYKLWFCACFFYWFLTAVCYFSELSFFLYFETVFMFEVVLWF